MIKSGVGFDYLDLIFKVTAGIKVPNLRQKNACLHVIACTVGWHVTRLVQLRFDCRLRLKTEN